MQNVNIKLAKTLKHQRETLTVEPLHAQLDPVIRYAAQIRELTGQAFHVVAIPEGSAAYTLGYRYASVPDSELQEYLAGGATLAN